jgi:23S rRNA pseudouridine2605 synthase
MHSNDLPNEPDLPDANPATAEGEAAPVPRRRARKPAAAEGDVAVAPAADAAPAEVAPAETAAVAAAPDAEAAAPEGEGAAEGESGRRGRNRRRGRGRGRDGAEAAPGEGPAVEGEAAAPREPAAAAPDPAEAVERFAEVLSGAYDAEPPEPDDAATLEQSTKRVLRPEPEAPKLHKVLAQSGIGSRRDMEQLIQDGAVTVNDQVAHIGMRIAQGDRVAVNGKPVRIRIHGTPARLLAYHKPAGEVVTFNDPEGRPTVFRRLPRLENGKWQSVGRLDINTEGLLLFTTSGELANQLMHPRFGVEREYAVRVLGSLDDEQRARLIEGVEIDGQPANFKSIEDGGGEGANRWYRVVITEGRNREVRKLFDKVGLAVSRLIRIRYGSVVLPRGLKRGVWVELGDAELRAIRQALQGGRGEPREVREAPPQRAERRNGRGGKPQGGPARPAQPPQQQAPRERPPRREREPRSFEPGPDGEDFGAIPNPLEQTFDRRFAKGPRRGTAQGFGHARPEVEHGPAGTIPNPLEQTFDKRFVKGSQRINAGFGRPDGDPHGGPAGGAKKGGPKQPDPMQTSVGYIGADAYFNKVGGKRGGGGGGGGNRGGQGGGGGGRRGR